MKSQCLERKFMNELPDRQVQDSRADAFVRRCLGNSSTGESNKFLNFYILPTDLKVLFNKV